MDEKVIEKINKAIGIASVIGCFPGLLSHVREADRIYAQKQKLIKLIGEEKASGIFDRIKNEAYAQLGNNGSYIYNELVKINIELEYGKHTEKRH
ncbi:hypothetical protein [Chryseobacterium sp. 2VB]|uniref:hypothetical protein n=1 Tax=Chryseobacterium sp. 2VB TaxID=2502204 RepID=UPI0010F6ECD2|nr:hypothetical protein [Chryseobacterium sp. 2VB]